jgi:hypothetical protein
MGVAGQHHVLAGLPPGKTWYPLYRRMRRSQGRSGWVRKISPPPGFVSPDHSACSNSLYRPIRDKFNIHFCHCYGHEKYCLCSPLEMYRSSGGNCCFNIQTRGNTLKMESACSPETQVNLFQTRVKSRIDVLVRTI